MPSTDATQLHGPEHVEAYLETDGEVGTPGGTARRR